MSIDAKMRHNKDYVKHTAMQERKIEEDKRKRAAMQVTLMQAGGDIKT